MPLNTFTKSYSVFSGEVYFDKENTSGVLTGERYFGNTPGGEISVQSTVLDHYDSDTNVVEKDFSLPYKIDRKLTLTVDDMSNDNIALFFAGGISTLAQAAGSIVDESSGPVTPGLHYQIGASLANPTGVRNISAVSVKVGATVKALNTDYLLDLVRGRILPVVGGTILANDTILVSYTKAIATRSQIATGVSASINGGLRFLANNLTGANRDIYMPRVSLKPTGSFKLKGGGENPAYASLQFEIEILKRTGYQAIYIDGQAA
ncbi:phage protein [Sulfuriferula multivorans]|uniref:Phage protein n=1 Tax=Sulfuriferula multivorans TaxID=1559896 RepID=A0A401JF47_9PROT|nr:hypothetical protein [Sulfuriferula multivorans]GBL46224.1 phage protein [Sulfuriferula multivorans]